jgi:hypothetical protein
MPSVRRPLALLLAAALLVSGCATANTEVSLPVVGRTVTVVTEPDENEVKGELLVVEKDRLYVRAEAGVREIPLGAVREARVKRHDFGKSKALTWSLIGGLVTGGALMGACSSVEGNGSCASAGLVTLGAWLAIGLLAAPSFESSSRIKLQRPSPEELRAFARLPQGLPAGVTPAALAAAAEQTPATPPR